MWYVIALTVGDRASKKWWADDLITGKVSTLSDNMGGMREGVESGNGPLRFIHAKLKEDWLKENNQLEKYLTN